MKHNTYLIVVEQLQQVKFYNDPSYPNSAKIIWRDASDEFHTLKAVNKEVARLQKLEGKHQPKWRYGFIKVSDIPKITKFRNVMSRRA